MLKIFGTAALLAVAGVAFAQTSTAPGTQPATIPSTAPGTPPSTDPTITPSQAPAVTPSQTPYVTPSQTPSVSPAPVNPPATVGGLSKCENMIGSEKDTCRQQERAGTGSTGTVR